MKNLINKIKDFLEDIKEKNIDENAAACAYYTILSFIPLLILILTVTKYFSIDEEIFINIIGVIVPTEVLNEAVISIVKETYSKSLSTITISAVFTLWSAGKSFFALCKGLNKVYEIEMENKYIKFRLRALISTIIFIFVVVFSLLILVFGNSINVFLQEKLNIFSKIINFVLKSKTLISIMSLTIILSLMYRFIPKHKYKYKEQIVGAIFSAIACNIISIFFSIYVDVFNGFSLMYGSLTTIVLAMFWIYGCMYSILLGGHINNQISKIVEKRR